MQGTRAWPVAGGGPSRSLPLQWARAAPDTFPQHGPCPLTSLSQETGDETPPRPEVPGPESRCAEMASGGGSSDVMTQKVMD